MFEIFSYNLIFNLSIIFFINFIIFNNFSKLTKLFNIYDKADEIRKFHKGKVSLIGGLIFLLNLCIFLLLIKTGSDNFYNQIFLDEVKQFLMWVLCILGLFIIGVYDDKFNIDNFKKLILTFFVIYFFVISDQTIHIKNFRFINSDANFSISNTSTLFTSFCFLSFIIIMNMYDGVNTNSINFFIFLILYILFKVPIFTFPVFILFSLLFLLYLNYNNKLFLGDSGVHIIAFVVSYILIKIYNQQYIKNIEQIILILLFPALDAIRVFIFRLLKNKSLFTPDRSHLHYLLKDKYPKNYISYLFFLNSTPFVLACMQILSAQLSILISLFIYCMLILKLRSTSV